MERRTGLRPFSAKRLAALAEQGVSRPWSTLVNSGAGLSRTVAKDVKPKPRRDTGPTRAVKNLVDARSGGMCEWPACPRPQQERHHRLNRKQGGRHGAAHDRINGAAWLLGACQLHHRRVTNPVGEARAEAERMGWILREHQDAETAPVLIRRGWVLLCPDGGMTSLSPNHDHTPA
ncbi:hypothetical protein GCM10011608_09340 [Micromonospora sonchi]|uniref:HNH endonuclease n=1 Tax=Micromonospora sonchi TaxID=1763543 RepID=A0A917TKN7_9ACTN|nr:hypothetical protein [Micromonospora sonchi]GGM26631.1 hypothetical protein GCM10011608_09340 [Micromonospora sonchi]